MQAGVNHIIVKVKGGLLNDKIVHGSLVLDAFQGKEAIADAEGKTTYNPYQNAKICGEVVSIPAKLSGSVLKEKYVGTPSPQKYYSVPDTRAAAFNSSSTSIFFSISYSDFLII